MINKNAIYELKIVPGWINRAIILNKLNSVDINCYSKMRSILSITDLAEWVYVSNLQLRDNGVVNVPISCNTLSVNSFTDMTQEQRVEFNNSVIPLSGTEDIKHNVCARLLIEGAQPHYYVFNPYNNTLVINEGFLDFIKTKNNEFLFIKDMLRHLYSLTSIAEVSKIPLFKLYLSHIEDSCLETQQYHTS